VNLENPAGGSDAKSKGSDASTAASTAASSKSGGASGGTNPAASVASSNNSKDIEATPIISNTSKMDKEKECISSSASSGGESRATNKSSASSSQAKSQSSLSKLIKNKSVLPPRIPSRSVGPETADATIDAQQQQQQQQQQPQVQNLIKTCPSSDGSIECSVLTQQQSEVPEMLQLTPDGNVEVSNLDGTPKVTRSPSKIITAASTDGSVEISMGAHNSQENAAVSLEKETPKISNSSSRDSRDSWEPTSIRTMKPLPIPEKTNKYKNRNKNKDKKSKEKYQKHQPKSPTDESVEDRGLIAGVPSLENIDEEVSATSNNAATSNDAATANDDNTATTEKDNVGKKDRLQKIMSYKNKISKKNLDQKTLDGWVVRKTKKGEKKEKKKGKTAYQSFVDGVTRKTDKGKKSLADDSDSKIGTKETLSPKKSLMDLTEEEEDKETLHGSSQLHSSGSVAASTRAEKSIITETAESTRAEKTIITETTRSIKTESNSIGGSKLEDAISTKYETKSRGDPKDSLLDMDITVKTEQTKKKEDEVQQDQEMQLEQRGQEVSLQMIPIVQSESSGGGISHPVKIVKFNANEDDDARDLDISLPPEIKGGKKTKIWTEDASREGNGVRTRQGRMSCLPTTVEDLDDVDTDVGSENGKEARQRSASSMFCGMGEMKTDVKGAALGIQGGIRSSIQKLFGACDITDGGGVDILANNITDANDQIFGRKPVAKSTAYSSAASQGRKESDTPKAEKETPQPQSDNPPKVKDILASSIENQKKQLLSEEKKKQSVPNDEQKKKLYLARLKQVSLKHL